MVLWILFAVMTAAAALIVIVPLNRARVRAAPNAEIDVYADQLDEVERDRERGLIGEREAEAARVEIARRLIRADRVGPVPAELGRKTRSVASFAAIVVIPAVALGLYSLIGSPGLPDQPLASRPAVPLDQRSPEALIAMLDAQLAKNPDDAHGWDIAGPIYFRIGRLEDATKAFANAIRLGGPNPQREIGLGQALMAAANGKVTPEAKAVFEAALKLEPGLPLARMYLALGLSQDGRLAESAAAWKALVAEAKPGDPLLYPAKRELAAVEAAIARAANPASPAADTKPPANQPAPAPASEPALTGDATAPPNSDTMIEGMVVRLADRLDRDGGSAEDWGKLVRSYLVLGRQDDAKTTVDKAHGALAKDPAALAAFDAILKDLGAAP
ncbi:MAG: c-type cytochrome biogenesis protein CcmI [Ancalomicrobiaceae bacterium]|nr:c-type cytochrome biogenesis protein CcmI [Ancalomicrobiaceae bacterium]